MPRFNARGVIARSLLVATSLLMTTLRPTHAETLGDNLITNGCFNNPYCGSSYCSPLTGTAIQGWTITSGDVEQLNGYIPNLPANCPCGGSIDMNGLTRGTIEQTVPTVNGNNYAIYFDYASNGASKVMDIYWCGTKIGSVTGAGNTWQSYSSVQAATGSSCTLKFRSMTSGNGGVVPTNVQVVPIGSATTNTYPQQPIYDGCPTGAPSKAPTSTPTKMPTQSPTTAPSTMPTQSPTTRPTMRPTTMPTKTPTQSPTAAYFLPQATGTRCAQAGVLVPDSVWTTYPTINIQRRRLTSAAEVVEGDAAEAHRQLTPGVPDAEMCYIYCSNFKGNGVQTYYNLRTLATKNECYCCGGTCTPVADPQYSYYQIMRPYSQPDPVPALPNYQQQGVGQRCAQQGTLKTPYTPQTEEQCWRLCSWKDGVQQPNTYYNIKTSITPRECYCVGSVCDMITDPNYTYGLAINPAPPSPACPRFASAATSPRAPKATAGSSFRYRMVIKDKTKLGPILLNGAAEYMLTLPAGVTPIGFKVSPAHNVQAARVNDSSIPANTYVWRLAATGKPVTLLRMEAKLTVDPCAASAVVNMEGSFWPFGRSVFDCGIGFGVPTKLTITANLRNCAAGPKPKKIKA